MYFSLNKIVESLPKSKNKKSSFWVKILIRRVSFLFTWLFINLGFSSNTVSYLSIFVALSGCITLSIDNLITQIIGVVLINLWLVFDCVDGNIARVKKISSPIGSLIDALSGYFMVAFVFLSIGIAAFNTNGIIFQEHSVYLVIIGAVASIADALARLIHQKYNFTMHLIGVVKPADEAPSKISWLRERIDKELGISGAFMPLLILALITQSFDLLVIFYGLFNVSSLVATFTYYAISAEKYNKLN
ncbi:CDP-alcohol phosphatidyltransferase family protein [Bacillus salacetis]|uniref:CDP-alcohol phosphatidyltransferase family protein n=1 Tax=Bacillus salacetis TaxID=2315464 RepID=UPI003BA14936